MSSSVPDHDRATTTFRLWIYTANDDMPGAKADVAICLHGALGSAWLRNLQDMRPSSSSGNHLFGSKDKNGGGGGRSEIYVSAQEVGTIQRITVAYAQGGASTDKCVSWRLQQVLVRHGGDGVVTCFPAAVELKAAGGTLLELLPKISWHEDMYGNCAEAPPPPPPNGEWRWPVAAKLPFDASLASASGAARDEESGSAASELEAMQIRLFDAILNEELLPIADAAVHDLTMQRTPGSFLHECVQCAAGTSLGAPSAGTMDEMRRHNVALTKKVEAFSGYRDPKEEAKKRTELQLAQDQLRKLQNENALLRSAAEENAMKLHRAAKSKKGALGKEEEEEGLLLAAASSAKSQACIVC